MQMSCFSWHRGWSFRSVCVC